MSTTTATKPVGLVELPLTFGSASSEVRTVFGKTIERRRQRCILTGDPFFMWSEIPAARQKESDPFPTLFSHIRSPAQRYRDVEAVAIQKASLDMRPDDPFRGEIEDLIRSGQKGLAEIIRERHPAPVVTPDPAALFDPGDQISLSGTIHKLFGLTIDESTNLVVNHRRGFNGIHGVIGGPKIRLTEQEAWCPPLHAVAIQNLAAIEARSGLVRSRFSLFRGDIDVPKAFESGAPIRDAHRPAQRGRDNWAEVITLLSPTRPVRSMIISSRDSCSI